VKYRGGGEKINRTSKNKKYYLLDVSGKVSVVSWSRSEEVFSVTFNIFDDEVVAVSCDDVISVYHWLDEILTCQISNSLTRCTQAKLMIVLIF